MAIFDFLKEIPLSALLREKLKDIEAELTKLKEVTARLISEVSEKDAKIATLIKQLESSTAVSLEEAAVRILQVLAGHNPDEEVQENVVAQGAGVGVQVAVYHLQNLARRKLVEAHHYAGMPSMDIRAETHWTLQHGGREFLIKSGLLT